MKQGQDEAGTCLDIPVSGAKKERKEEQNTEKKTEKRKGKK
ncbi:MAG: hypothetical protein N2V73_03345 [Candidatus Methanospirare jalkutatii]|nr:hypothetical protein [Candidatus Methanospirare jalkutatii]MCW7078335.1 hypothetical protein [Candidatus Methanoxibalbensis ujae]